MIRTREYFDAPVESDPLTCPQACARYISMPKAEQSLFIIEVRDQYGNALRTYDESSFGA